MTASELAFLALGLLLGAATGAALIVIHGNRAPRREIRVTVTRDALPRRSETLSQDAFVAKPSTPAPGGPGDRRRLDRAGQPVDRVGIPIQPEAGGWMPPRPGPVIADPVARATPAAPVVRTAVPSASPAAVAVATREAVSAQVAAPPALPIVQPGRASALERILRGDHGAMVDVLDRIAGEDAQRRHEWEVLIGGLVEGMSDAAVRESVIEFPMGTAFWDTFTVEQCRRIVAALASMGYRYDGRSGWAEGRVPGYRHLTQAVADTGENPQRMRAWPNALEIAALFAGARPAPEELLPAAGPEYAAEAVRALLGERGPDLGNLWLAWDAVRPALLAEPASGEPMGPGGAPIA